jgi:hypothetical protein
MVLDLVLPNMSGLELLERLQLEPEMQRIPVIIYTSKDLSREEEVELKQFAEAVIVKDASSSADRLLNETANFLHKVSEAPAAPPEPQRAAGADPLNGARVLVVDDDVRNIFALASVLEANHVEVLYAENGKDGIRMLTQHPDVNLVLMDIMMPEMDGYETMQAIRQMPAFQKLPIISLTAKAMPGDRDKCLQSGASDYISKPVNMEQLLSMMRGWLESTKSPTP